MVSSEVVPRSQRKARTIPVANPNFLACGNEPHVQLAADRPLPAQLIVEPESRLNGCTVVVSVVSERGAGGLHDAAEHLAEFDEPAKPRRRAEAAGDGMRCEVGVVPTNGIVLNWPSTSTATDSQPLTRAAAPTTTIPPENRSCR